MQRHPPGTASDPAVGSVGPGDWLHAGSPANAIYTDTVSGTSPFSKVYNPTDDTSVVILGNEGSNLDSSSVLQKQTLLKPASQLP